MFVLKHIVKCDNVRMRSELAENVRFAQDLFSLEAALAGDAFLLANEFRGEFVARA